MAPLYDFYCATCDESEEHFFGFADKQEVTCVECGADMTKTIFAVGVIFRGGGWGGQ
jgi:putative FmdB family regulatory protein